MAVAVSFNYRHDLHARTEQAAKFAHVMLNVVEIYFRPGWLKVKMGSQ
jgi:hypothetical protein